MTALAEARAPSTRLSPFDALMRLEQEIGEEALRRALRGAEGTPPLHRRVIARILRREPALALLAGSVDALASHRLSWPAKSAHARASFRLGGAATFQIEGDRDGSILDGAIIYDGSSEVFLRVALKAEGGVSGTRRRRKSDASARADASAEGAVEVSNWFRHGRDEPALPAVRRDLGDMVLPSEIGARPLRREGGVPMQYVHLGWTGSVQVGGSLSLSRMLLALGSAGALGVSAPWVESAVDGLISWTGSIEGTFDLVVFPLDTSRVAVRLSRSTLSARRGSAAVRAEVAIEPVAAVAGRITGILFEPLDPLVRVLERDRRRFADLHGLLRAELTDEVEELLRGATIADQIRQWLQKIGVDVELRARLREVLLDVFDEMTARAVDEMQSEIEPVLTAVRELVRRVATVRRTLNQAVEESLRVKVALELARRRRVLDESSVLLECRIDPVADRASFAALLRGDWRPALAAHRSGGSIEMSGTFLRERLSRIESELMLELAGKEIGIGSLLRQDWAHETTADGDLRLEARGELEVWSRGWRALRTVEALASTEILESLAGERASKRTFRFEWSEESKPSLARLRELGARLAAAGILAEPDRFESDLAIEGERHSARPFGRLEVTARLRLSGQDLARVATVSPRLARRTFAGFLASEYAGASPLSRTDRTGLPLFAWPDVLAKVERAAVNPRVSRVVFASPTGRGVGVRRELLPTLTLLARLVLLFSKLHGEMRALARAAGSAGAPRKVAPAQQRMLEAMRPILTATAFRRGDLGMAVFRTLAELATDPGSRPRVDVVVLREDGERFVY